VTGPLLGFYVGILELIPRVFLNNDLNRRKLAIKRLKSLLVIDQLRARKDSPLAELYRYGKLRYAAVIEKLIARRVGQHNGGLNPQRAHTP